MRMMNRLKAAWKAFQNKQTVSLDDPELLEWLGIDAGSKKQLSEVTYFTCMKLLSETMGKLPLKFYKQTDNGKTRAEPNRAARLLMNRPNKYMTPATFWGTIEFNCQHHGNSYVWIQTQYDSAGAFGGTYRIQSFFPMQSECVSVLMDDAGVFGEAGNLYYRYADPKTGKTYTFGQEHVLHFKTWNSKDGIIGKSVRETLKETIAGASESQRYLNKMYQSGLTASAALQYTENLSPQERAVMEKEYNALLTGARNAGKVVAMPMGFKLEPLNIKLTDAQFFELKKHTALQIAGAFGIKPNQLNNYEKSSYANSETQQLAFLVDTMAYRLAQYEQEINRKCLTDEEVKEGYFFKFNEKALLRTDSKTQRENIVAYVTNGLYTINEGRELLDLPAVEGGDVNMVNGTYQPITRIGAAYEEGPKEGQAQEGGEEKNGD